jgi:hypothetical protein
LARSHGPGASAFAHHLATLVLLAQVSQVCRKRTISRRKVSICTLSITRRCATLLRLIHKKKKWTSIVKLRAQIPFLPQRQCTICMLRITSLMVDCVRGWWCWGYVLVYLFVGGDKLNFRVHARLSQRELRFSDHLFKLTVLYADSAM